MKIHCFEHAGINRHALRLKAPPLPIQSLPIRRAFHANHRHVPGNHPQLGSTSTPQLPEGVPATVVDSAIALRKFPGRLHRYMHGLERDISKEGAPVLPVRLDEFHGFIDEKC